MKKPAKKAPKPRRRSKAKKPPSQIYLMRLDVLDGLARIHDRQNETNERLRVIEADIEKIQRYVGVLASNHD